MAGEAPSFYVNGNVGVSCFVKPYTSADNTVAIASTNDIIAGISSEAGRAPNLPGVTVYAGITGDQMKVYGDGQVCLLTLGTGGATAGDKLKSDSSGYGVVAATTGTTVQQIGAEALQTGSAGDRIKVRVLRHGFLPAVS